MVKYYGIRIIRVSFCKQRVCLWRSFSNALLQQTVNLSYVITGFPSMPTIKQHEYGRRVTLLNLALSISIHPIIIIISSSIIISRYSTGYVLGDSVPLTTSWSTFKMGDTRNAEILTRWVPVPALITPSFLPSFRLTTRQTFHTVCMKMKKINLMSNCMSNHIPRRSNKRGRSNRRDTFEYYLQHTVKGSECELTFLLKNMRLIWK